MKSWLVERVPWEGQDPEMSCGTDDDNDDRLVQVFDKKLKLNILIYKL